VKSGELMSVLLFAFKVGGKLELSDREEPGTDRRDRVDRAERVLAEDL
jgi:hypothetical protein